MTYATGLFTSLAWLTHYTGRPWALYYLVLWALPLATSFAYLMILREAVQHGDLGQERFAHTRNFQGNPLIRWAVFPLGMNYHMPHHCFPMVPHYRLKGLHRLLLEAESYAERVIVVEGRLVPGSSGRAAAVLTRDLGSGGNSAGRGLVA
jgi:fatty acid desaturase